MSAQLDIEFAAPLFRRADPQTSVAAANKVDTFRATHEGKIYAAICDSGDTGMTYREIAAQTNLEPVAVARRLASMNQRRLIARRWLKNTFSTEYLERDGMAIWYKRADSNA